MEDARGHPYYNKKM